MAKKSLILSNNDGRVLIKDTSSVYIEENDNSIVVDTVTASNFEISNLQNSLLRYKNGNVEIISGANGDGFPLIWDGTNWTSQSFSISSYSGNSGGDFSGSAPSVSLVNISNISSGTLPSKNGGTGISISSLSNRSLLVLSGSTYSTIPVDINSKNKSLQSSAGDLNFYKITTEPLIQFYTASAATANGGQTIYNWTKPSGYTYIRIICQGAGGGGSGGHSFNGGIHQGSGGGSGGFSDKVYALTSISSTATISVGKGGAGGLAHGSLPYTGYAWLGTGDGGGTNPGGSGGNSSFVGTVNVTSYGGGGANWGWIAGGSSGTGLTFNGSGGGFNSGNVAAGGTATNASTGGGTGGGGAGGTIVARGCSSTYRDFAYFLDIFKNGINIGISQGASGVTWNGAATAKPTKPLNGAGGAGGTAANNTGQSEGGNGGDGWVLVVCW